MNSNKQIIRFTLLCESFTNRSNVLVMVGQAKNERDRRQTSPFAKVGRIAGQTIRGWIRHTMEKLLLMNGVSVCHPISKISATSDRNKEYFKEDLTLGYHSRGDCAEKGGCLIYQIFGDLDAPGNLIVPSAYFYPTTTGNGRVTKEINKVFGSVGGGRIELTHCSPRARAKSHRTYMSMETIVGVMIKAPVNLILIQANRDHEVALLKTLEFLKTMNQEYEYDFLLGGMRGQGYGRAALLPMMQKSKKTKQKSLAPNEEGEELEEGNGTYKIQFKLTKPQGEKLEQDFQSIIAKEKKRFSPSMEDIDVKEVVEASL
ncbi:MAG: hypothetical protein HWN65_09545 [Candidatus Helarchaeota archaeon]|nr:hypothetical protein [Candidatus Helarchaeota archaeon]